jgi:hypothetical protein
MKEDLGWKKLALGISAGYIPCLLLKLEARVTLLLADCDLWFYILVKTKLDQF